MYTPGMLTDLEILHHKAIAAAALRDCADLVERDDIMSAQRIYTQRARPSLGALMDAFIEADSRRAARRRAAGFTLIEIMIVIVIMGILALLSLSCASTPKLDPAKAARALESLEKAAAAVDKAIEDTRDAVPPADDRPAMESVPVQTELAPAP